MVSVVDGLVKVTEFVFADSVVVEFVAETVFVEIDVCPEFVSVEFSGDVTEVVVVFTGCVVNSVFVVELVVVSVG